MTIIARALNWLRQYRANNESNTAAIGRGGITEYPQNVKLRNW